MIFYYAYLAFFFKGVFFYNLFYMFLVFEDIILIHL